MSTCPLGLHIDDCPYAPGCDHAPEDPRVERYLSWQQASEAVATPAGPTLDEIRHWPATVDVRTACRAIGISGAWGYELLKRGEFPCKVLTIRNRTRVLTASLVALLSVEGVDPS